MSSAQAGVEIGGTAGPHIFSDENGLGAPDNSPVYQSNSALFGARIGVYFSTMLGLEIEGAVIPTESAGTDVKFDIWNAAGRAQIVAQFRADNPSNNIIPFVLVGGGIMKVVDFSSTDESLFEKATAPHGYLGVGAKYRASGGWGVRVDGRAIGSPGRDSGAALDFEILLGLYKDFGAKAKAPVEEKKETPPPADEDPDKDGILGDADKCPSEAEDKDGFEDDNGCPDADNDADGIADASDKCATEPEDKDNFQDDDGCPDPDNDNDGVADAGDKCADQPETRNGFEDEDGCPDELPQKLAQYTGTIAGINFKVNSADLLPASNKTLDKAVAVLTEFKDVKLEIQGHTDDQQLKAGGKFPDNDALSQARAESVKAYFVKKGITEDRLIAKGYGATVPVEDPTGLKGAKLNAARTKNRRVEFKLISPGGEAPAPAEPKAEEPKAEAPKAEAPKPENASSELPKKN